MEKRKRWQKVLIGGVLLLTVYNILPTIFYYTKPLGQPIDEQKALGVSSEIIGRVNRLEEESKQWLGSFCKSLKVKPLSIQRHADHPDQLSVQFKSVEEANTFRNHLPRAGALISFVPSQLSLLDTDRLSKTVVVKRKIPVELKESNQQQLFQFSEKFDGNGLPSPLYRSLVFDRVVQLAHSIAGPNDNAQLAQALVAAKNPLEKQELALRLSQNIATFTKVFNEKSAEAKRYFSSFSQAEIKNKEQHVQGVIQSLEMAKDQSKLDRIALQSEAQSLQAKGFFLDTEKQQKLEQLAQCEKILEQGISIIKKHKAAFANGTTPFSQETLLMSLQEDFEEAQKGESITQTLSFEGIDPFIQKMIINWASEKIELILYPEVVALKERLEAQGKFSQKEQFNQLLYNEIATFSRASGETIRPYGSQFVLALNRLEGSNSFLALDIASIAKDKASQLEQLLREHWRPRHVDLVGDNFPVFDYATYSQLPPHEQKLGLVVCAPSAHSGASALGLKNGSVYVIAKGLDKILQKTQTSKDAQEAQLLNKDFQSLRALLQESGLFGYPGSTLSTSQEFANDVIFEGEEFYQPILKATREDFSINGTKKYAILEFTNVGQRILTRNKVANQIHENLLKWRDDYRAAQVGLAGTSPFDVPKPTQNILWSNLLLSAKKYFAGDDRKVLRWGLDLSGGKTVQIELRDQNNQVVTNEEEIDHGINELYQRVNKMGVSEVSIRREGHCITLDFPGTQGLSASELIKSSTMYFHIVNEKFNEKNQALATNVNQFLQDVWNEAVVTGRKTSEELNQIAWRHMHGDSLDSDVIQPRSESARILYENGLRLASPYESKASNLFNDAVSKVALLRGTDFTQWQGKTHPLVFVFHHFALEGASLKNVQSGYDQNKGNFLNFEIKGSETLPNGERVHPREDLFAWTSQFSKDKITGTPNASYSGNDGWRMAVILNGTIATAPTLNSAIRDGGSIEGGFTQREVNQLEADLKAGSLSYTPHILSEKNVSPELGAKERNFGILATCIALVLVIACMISYYRFGGMIASIAVVVNLLIMWATLQNLGATLTLATIAGAILTLGMAVDANVLVFERIREEFNATGRLAAAVHSGYQKAFSAILDSNITTIIAAVILLQFDSGPIKGFALTLIIGIASSMFTALFMTRTFFAQWVQNPKHKKLNMASMIKAVKFNFLKASKFAIFGSLAIVAVGSFLFVQQRHTMMGMDFTGGYSLNLELENIPGRSYREEVEKALVSQGASGKDFQVRQLTPAHHIRLFLSKNLQEVGGPFYQMPPSIDQPDAAHAYTSNPRIHWVVDALEKEGIHLSSEQLSQIESNWSEISGQLSNAMRNNALIGLGIAILSILVYITIRFEFKYAVSATLCLAHDIAISLASIAILNYFGLPLQIDLNTVAALMTIVGYSLNDTIIVFDRIREDLVTMRKASFVEVVNHALNVTLSRTTMTSMTTLLVLLPLVCLGGSTIFAFALVMIVGVVFGTLSSLFIAAPILNFFHKRQVEKNKVTVEIVN